MRKLEQAIQPNKKTIASFSLIDFIVVVDAYNKINQEAWFIASGLGIADRMDARTKGNPLHVYL